MIKVSSNISAKLERRIFKSLIKKVIRRGYEQLKIEFQKDQKLSLRFKNFLNEYSLRHIIFIAPNSIEDLVESVYKHFPEIKEGFNTKSYFSSLKLSENLLTHSLRGRDNKELFNSKLNNLLEILKKDWNSSYYVNEFLDEIDQKESDSEKKQILNHFSRICSGTVKELGKFPIWVTIIPKLFDYSSIETGLLYDLIEEYDVTVCPYCNQVKLPYSKTAGIKYRPDLDHFFPKSLYPFLALSIFNLVPACQTCNTPLKRSKDVFGLYLNPHISGVSNDCYFSLTHSDLLKATFDKHDYSLYEIQLLPLSAKLNSNAELFDIKARYNTKDYKEKAMNHFRAKNESAPAEIGYYKRMQEIDISNEHPQRSVDKKVKVDLFNQIFEENVRTY